VTLLDTSILGTVARIGALDLLFALFAKDELGVAPAVDAEVVAGVSEGRRFLQPVVELVKGGQLTLIALTAAEVVQRLSLPTSLGDGEAESIALCQSRGAAFVTNDRRARNFCLSKGIEVFDLIDVLRALWKLGICSKRRVRQLAADIETKEGMVIKRKEEIFAPAQRRGGGKQRT
jgi:predicted nucleic acid-binding protein